MPHKIYFLISVIAITVLMALPALAQEDRSSDTSFQFAGRAEYNKPASDTASGSAEGVSEGLLPDTGGSNWVLLPAAGGLFLASAVLMARRHAR